MGACGACLCQMGSWTLPMASENPLCDRAQHQPLGVGRGGTGSKTLLAGTLGFDGISALENRCLQFGGQG